MDQKRHIKDVMYEFLSEPSREKFRQLLWENTGEENNLDFKEEWIEKGPLSKLLLALGNYGGGIIVFGVKENDNGTMDPIGLQELKDKAYMDDFIKRYVPVELKYELLNYAFEASEYDKLIGKKFQVVWVKDTPESLPFISLADTENLSKDTIYIRRGTKCEKANAKEIERIINRRIETQYSSSSTLDLEEHLKQLKILYTNINKMTRKLIEGGALHKLSDALVKGFFNGEYEDIPNPDYPGEDYEKFIIRMIKNKKIKIEKVLDLK